MKKGAKTGGTNRNIRTLSRKDNPHEAHASNKRNHLADKHTYQNQSGLFPSGNGHDRSNSQIPRGQLKQPIELNFQVNNGPNQQSSLQQVKLNLKKGQPESGYHKHSISNSNARSMNSFLNTEPMGQGVSGGGNHAMSANEAPQKVNGGQGSVGENNNNMLQFEDRKKVVAAIYLNTMSTKISNVDARERQRRRQSDTGVHPQAKLVNSSESQESGPVRGSNQNMNRSQLYGVDKTSGGRPQISKFRQEYITKRNGRSGQYSSSGPGDERGDPYQQKELFQRHPNKLSKLKNSSASETQLRDQRNQGSGLRRDFSGQPTDGRVKNHQFQQQSQVLTTSGIPSKSPLINSRKMFEANIKQNQPNNMSMIQHHSSQQLDLNTMGKSQNISIHQKSNSSSLPASFANNYASNSQRLTHHKNSTNGANGNGPSQGIYQKNSAALDHAEQQFMQQEQSSMQKAKVSNKLFKNLPIQTMAQNQMAAAHSGYHSSGQLPNANNQKSRSTSNNRPLSGHKRSSSGNKQRSQSNSYHEQHQKDQYQNSMLAQQQLMQQQSQAGQGLGNMQTQFATGNTTQNIQIVPKQQQRVHKSNLSQIVKGEQNRIDINKNLGGNKPPSSKQKQRLSQAATSNQATAKPLNAPLMENQGAEQKMMEMAQNARQANSALIKRPMSSQKNNMALNTTTINNSAKDVATRDEQQSALAPQIQMKGKQVKTRQSNRSQSLSDVKPNSSTDDEGHKQQQTSGAYYTNNSGNLYGRVDPPQSQLVMNGQHSSSNTTQQNNSNQPSLMPYTNSGSNTSLKYASNQGKNVKQQVNHQRRSNSQMVPQQMPVVSGTNFVQQNGSTNVEQVPAHGTLFVKQFGWCSVAGNVGRTASAKINQDSVFVSKIMPDGKAITDKNQLKQGPHKVDWFCAVADGHGANGHFVSQFIQAQMPKQYEIEKKRYDRQKNSTPKHGSGGKAGEQQEASAAHSNQKQTKQEFEAQSAQISSNLISTFLNTQQKLESQTGFDCSLSGSTVVGMFQKKNTFYFANAGDSRGIVIGDSAKSQSQEFMNERGGDANMDTQIVILAQTRDHKPDLPDEVDRIVNQYEGQINNTHAQTLVIQSIQGVNSVAPPKPSQKLGPPRVWVLNQTYPGLAMSRSLGDVLAKKAGVIAEPEISSYTYDPETVSHHLRSIMPKWIVMASDGVWDVMSNEQVAHFLYDPINANKSAQKLSEQLLRYSRSKWLQAPANMGVQHEQFADIDDISVLILKLDWSTSE